MTMRLEVGSLYMAKMNLSVQSEFYWLSELLTGGPFPKDYWAIHTSEVFTVLDYVSEQVEANTYCHYKILSASSGVLGWLRCEVDSERNWSKPVVDGQGIVDKMNWQEYVWL